MSDNAALLKTLHAVEESNKAINKTLIAILAHLARMEEREYGARDNNGGNTPMDYGWCVKAAHTIINHVAETPHSGD